LIALCYLPETKDLYLYLRKLSTGELQWVLFIIYYRIVLLTVYCTFFSQYSMYSYFFNSILESTVSSFLNLLIYPKSGSHCPCVLFAFAPLNFFTGINCVVFCVRKEPIKFWEPVSLYFIMHSTCGKCEDEFSDLEKVNSV
jgi:hypothetical protein